MRFPPLVLALAMAACAAQETRSQPRPISAVTGQDALKPASSVEGEKELGPPPVAPATQPRVTQPLKVDTSKKLEIVDVYVNTKDPNGMRRLVPYLLRSEEWMILKVEYTSLTTRHYRFQRVASPKDSFPMPDPLIPRKST